MGECISVVVGMIEMQPCGGTGIIKTAAGVEFMGEDKKPHMIHLSGTFIGGKDYREE